MIIKQYIFVSFLSGSVIISGCSSTQEIAIAAPNKSVTVEYKDGEGDKVWGHKEGLIIIPLIMLGIGSLKMLEK